MKADQKFTKFKYRVISYSSQDSQHTISDLINNVNEGWQSIRFCDFPQELTLQFLSPVTIKQIQFLSHQYKISSKIEIMTYLPEIWDPLANNNVKFKKLGFLTLDRNETSNFKARELKTILIDAPCSYIKFLLHKNHSNKFNVFNQVGLVQINIFGDFFTRETERKRENEILSLLNENQLNQLDETTQDRIKTLMNAKEMAIKNEDYEKAKKIKAAIEQLKLIGSHLTRLEQQKNMAINSEDYDTAKIITSEILKLRNSISPEALLGAANKNDKSILPPVKNPNKSSFADLKVIGNEVNKSDQEIIADIEPIKKEEENFIPEMIQPDDQSDRNNNTILDKNEISSIEKQSYFKLSYDDQLIPTLTKNKQNIDENQPINPEELIPEKLSLKKQKLAEPLKNCIPEDILEKIFSKRWQFKEEGLAWVEKEISQISSKKEDAIDIIVSSIGVINYTLKAKVAQITLKSFKILSSILKIRTEKISTKSEMVMYIDNILYYTIEKISDNNKKIKEEAEKIFLELCNSPIFGLQICIASLVKLFDQKKQNQLPKITNIRLKLLEKIIEIYKSNSEINISIISDFVIKNLNNSNLDVRNTAQNLVKLIIKIMGEDKIKDKMLAWDKEYRTKLKLDSVEEPKNKKNLKQIPKK